jgi:predicted peptidase
MITKTTSFGRKYREYSDNPDKPLLIYLHGSGQRGSNPLVIDSVPFVTIFVNDHKDKFTILAPQQSSEFFGWQGAPNTKHDGAEFVEWAIENYSHDGRVFVTGHSMGGHGTWDVATILREKITGFVAISGRSDNYQGVLSLGKLGTPGKHFHGQNDNATGATYAQGVQVTNWYRSGAQAASSILVTYPGLGHNIDAKVYTEENLHTWFLAIDPPEDPPVNNDVPALVVRRGNSIIAIAGGQEFVLN